MRGMGLLLMMSVLFISCKKKENIYKEGVPERVLFVGNSFTQGNKGLDFHLRELLNHNIFIKTDKIGRFSIGGFSLEKHWQKGRVQRIIKSQSWDVVILQELSYRPIKDKDLMQEYAIRFDSLIKSQGAQTCLFMTWAYSQNLQMIDPLSEAYYSVGERVGAIVVPVGMAWKRMFAQQESINLHHKDRIHPNLAGSFLTSCMFYTYLYDENPVKNHYVPEGLSKETARAIKEFVWDFYQDDTRK